MPQLAHNVYFTLYDNSPASVLHLVEACRKYLTGHPGTLYFAAGPCNQDLRRSVNDLDYDVALIVIFASMADHDAYQSAPRHQDFILENKHNWKTVRVFDADVG